MKERKRSTSPGGIAGLYILGGRHSLVVYKLETGCTQDGDGTEMYKRGRKSPRVHEIIDLVSNTLP